MSKVRSEFEPLQKSDIIVPEFSEKDILLISFACVEKILEKNNANQSIPKGDIPPKIIKKFAKCLSVPLATNVNSYIKEGFGTYIFREETVTPVPKVQPPKSIEDLRDISGLLTFDIVAEKIIGE